ncbi:MAG: hypothetical protein NVS1B4_23590 [Gemmatimonadaceae bacterium]
MKPRLLPRALHARLRGARPWYYEGEAPRNKKEACGEEKIAPWHEPSVVPRHAPVKGQAH